MRRSRTYALAMAATLIGAAACSNNDVGSPDLLSASSAFNSAPAGFTEVTSSFAAGDGSALLPWMPDRAALGFPGMAMGGYAGGDGGPRGPGMRGLMGGGMDGAFVGGEVRGRGHERGPFAGGLDSACVFAASTDDVTCAPTTRNGLTVSRINTFKTLSGTAQAAPDSTTDYNRTRITVTGTATRRENVTATVRSISDRVTTGLSAASTRRTVNGTASGSEASSGTNLDGKAFTATRTSGDTTVNLIIPRSTAGTPSSPISGSVTRSMRAVNTITGEAATNTTRREVITYDGTATAKVLITIDGTTRSCTMPLPRGRLVCP